LGLSTNRRTTGSVSHLLRCSQYLQVTTALATSVEKIHAPSHRHAKDSLQDTVAMSSMHVWRSTHHRQAIVWKNLVDELSIPLWEERHAQYACEKPHNHQAPNPMSE